jgi:hypothetical protein
MLLHLLFATAEGQPTFVTTSKNSTASQELVTFNLDGSRLTLTKEKIEKYPDSLLAKLLKQDSSSVDRNAEGDITISLGDVGYHAIDDQFIPLTQEQIPMFVHCLKEFFHKGKLSAKLW